MRALKPYGPQPIQPPKLHPTQGQRHSQGIAGLFCSLLFWVGGGGGVRGSGFRVEAFGVLGLWVRRVEDFLAAVVLNLSTMITILLVIGELHFSGPFFRQVSRRHAPLTTNSPH